MGDFIYGFACFVVGWGLGAWYGYVRGGRVGSKGATMGEVPPGPVYESLHRAEHRIEQLETALRELVEAMGEVDEAGDWNERLYSAFDKARSILPPERRDSLWSENNDAAYHAYPDQPERRDSE